jgi:uncharacterized protein (TIGR02285 family)
MKRLIMLISMFTWMVSAHAEPTSNETVDWYINSFPPYFIISGPDKDQGAIDQAMRVMMKKMPEFKHNIVEAALSRVIEQIKTTPNACSASLLRNKEREAVMDFSSTHMRVLPNGIVTKRDRLPIFKPYLNEHGQLRLADFLATGKYHLGLAPDRSYGAGIDAILKKYPEAIVSIPASDQFSSRLLKLAKQNEFDAIVGYAIELKYTVREFKLSESDFAVLPVAEASDLLSIAVGCSKSEMGQRILAGINRALADPKTQQEIEGFYRAWLDNETAAYYDRMIKRTRTAQ